ncbi:MAG: hypothetical protein K6A37_03490 [Saccharofermentans sp.]|nr:hypothetical protein [Saccharofermentans sp.]
MCTGITYIYNEKTSESDIYFFGQDGVMQTGWVRIYDYKLYFLPSGKAADGWKKIDNKWYFFDDGEAFTGLHNILGESYYFGLPYKADGSVNPDAGVMVTGWLKRGDFSDYGSIVAGWSYFKSNGTMATGWQKIDGKWYYFLPKKYDGMAGYMLTGPNAVYDDAREITQYYCFSSSGAMQTNHWYQTVNHWSYYGSDGTRVSGWQKINGKWYYFSPYMYTGLRYISGILYDFGTDGACVNPPEDS